MILGQIFHLSLLQRWAVQVASLGFGALSRLGHGVCNMSIPDCGIVWDLIIVNESSSHVISDVSVTWVRDSHKIGIHLQSMVEHSMSNEVTFEENKIQSRTVDVS